MGLTDDELVQRLWDDNVRAVQDAKAAITDAQRAYTAACTRHAEVVGPLRRRAMTGRLTDQEADMIEAADATVAAAHEAKTAATAGLEGARARFKAGVTTSQVAAARKGH